MNIDALLAAPWHIQVHAFSAFGAFALGLIQFLAPKGTIPHRIIGPFWVLLMVLVTVSAVFIVRPREPGESFFVHFSFIHYIFIPVTTFGIIGGLLHIARGGPNMKKHGGSFFGIFLGGIIIAGAFTFMPGRIMHDVVFGTDKSSNADFYQDPYFYFLPGAEPPPKKDAPSAPDE